MATQQRCVFVGNIPYDATEEQLIRICEEVGPVVSFRLVTDRETGKPKGYGFCEYKDEETALSARRNLQGYEINGRQLRVDFAENDKNADKSREQGRGGPGMTTNTGDSQKQVGPPAGVLDSGLHQPVGLPVAIAAAAVMSEALGGAQVAIKSTQISLDIQQGFGTDPLTMHLSRMSRNQLIDILSELKMLATENKEQARQLLLAAPLLAKAIFQVQLMLGVVTPQMLQMPNIRQASVSLKQPSLQDVVQSHQLGVQTLPNLPPLAQKKMQFELMPKSQEGEVHAGHPNSLAQNSYTLLSQFPTQTRVQLPVLSQNKYQQQGPTPALPGVSTVPSIHSQHIINMSIRPQIPLTASPNVKQQAQPLMFQHRGQALPAKMGHNGQLVLPHGNREPSVSDSYRDPFQSLPLGLPKKATLIHDHQDTVNHSSKLLKMNDGRPTSYSADVNVSTSAGSQVFGYANHLHETEEASSSAKKASELPSEVESALLQQVMSLTPEQLSSLPPDQRQQVIQLQQMLRPS